jgi:hypothetical protein
MRQAEPAASAAPVSASLVAVVTEELAAMPPQPQLPAPPMVLAMVWLLRLPQAAEAETAATP